MPKIVVTHWVHPEVVEALRPHGEVDANDGRESWAADELGRRVRDADAVVVFMPDRVDDAFLAAAPRLRIVAGALKGFDNLDVAACTRRGVWVTIVEDLLTVPTADLALALLLALTRNVVPGDRRVRAPGYAGWRPVLYGSGLEGRRVGIVGYGRLGRAVAKRLAGFDAEVVVHDPAAAGDPRALPLAELLATSDHVVLTAPLVPATFHALDAAGLAQMKPGVYLVNVGRGSVVDEGAVAAALATGRLAGYAADVFEFEDLSLPARPRAIPPALLAFPDRTVFTPHLGSAVDDVRREIALSAARSVIDALDGRKPRGAVNDVR
ncbi:MAG: hydroxyacid dehydrogenase [Planctomycetes bacterium]|nr:hydroxyacid dehydrogenase [Planctomycetota bacterium]